ncbi:MAG: hypothetical protein O7E56_01015 [SAR324 cluster bacterium]|nr:hypothetical protein [SAR324 cluster bacterium]
MKSMRLLILIFSCALLLATCSMGGGKKMSPQEAAQQKVLEECVSKADSPCDLSAQKACGSKSGYAKKACEAASKETCMAAAKKACEY